jgi:hypothetical protein
MNKIVKYIAIIFAVIIIVLLGILIFVKPAQKPEQGPEPGAFVSPNGHLVIYEPNQTEVISSPVTIMGHVTGGGWFFEATFPVKIIDADGTILGQGPAQARGEWTSTGTVPFAATIPFTAPHSATGMIVFSKDNPSGLPQNNESFSVPVRFK